jgi:hypothetical protein
VASASTVVTAELATVTGDQLGAEAADGAGFEDPDEALVNFAAGLGEAGEMKPSTQCLR